MTMCREKGETTDEAPVAKSITISTIGDHIAPTQKLLRVNFSTRPNDDRAVVFDQLTTMGQFNQYSQYCIRLIDGNCRGAQERQAEREPRRRTFPFLALEDNVSTTNNIRRLLPLLPSSISSSITYRLKMSPIIRTCR